MWHQNPLNLSSLVKFAHGLLPLLTVRIWIKNVPKTLMDPDAGLVEDDWILGTLS